VAFPEPPLYVEIPGVGAGIGLVRAEMKVGVADGVGDALGDGVATGTGETLGDGRGVGIGVGMTTGFLTPVDFFLTQTNFPDLALHSNSPPLLFAVTPTFLQGAPLFTAA